MNERALFDAILANPDDDDVRLVYADALESAGDPRGELIQIQCRLARGHDEALAARETELLKLHGQTWLADLVALGLNARFTFHRGFVDTMDAHFPAATTRAAELLAHAPLLSMLHLTVHGQTDRVQLARPNSTVVLERARSLSIRGRHRGNTRDARGPIATCSGLAAARLMGLRALRLEALRTKPDDLADFLRTVALDALVLLLRMPAAEAKVVLRAIADVRVLDLSWNTLEAPSIAALLDTPHDRLETLSLDGTQLPPAGLELLREARLPALRAISLRHQSLRESLRDPAAWRNAPQLQSIVV